MVKTTLKKSYRSFFYALNGFKTTWKEEHNFRIETFCGSAVVLFAYFFNFSLLEWSLCILSIIIVLTGEIVNTAIEDLCNKVEPEHDPAIGKIKDTMAAFVFVSSIGVSILGILIFAHHFIQ